MTQPLTIKQIAAQVRSYLRAAKGCRVAIHWLHERIGCRIEDLLAALDTIKGLVRVRGTGACVALG